MKKRIACYLVLLVNASIVVSSCSDHHPYVVPKTPEVSTFSKTFGGDNDDYFTSVTKTADGGYVMVGDTYSANGSGDIPSTSSHGLSSDIMVVKVGSDGTKQWVTTINGNDQESAQAIVASPDGSGYVIVGHTASSNNGDIPVAHPGSVDILVAKVGLDGKKLWIKTYGGEGDDIAKSAAISPDGSGYVIAGFTTSDNSGDIPPIHKGILGLSFLSDVVVVKIGLDGTRQWIKTYGGNIEEEVRTIIPAPDGSGYVIAGFTSTNNNGDIPVTHGEAEMMILKIGIDGSKQWVKTYGGNSYDFSSSIAADRNGYMITGFTISNDNGDVPAIHVSGENYDMIVARLDLQGNKQWVKTYGGSGDDDAFSIASTPDGNFVIAGYTSSIDGDIPGAHATADPYIYDLVIAKLGPDGGKQWIKSYGGKGDDGGLSIITGADGGYVVVGSTKSNSDGDIPANHSGDGGYYDGWIIKIRD